MACTEISEPPNADSEMEEGEIVDDIDYLSDISSEEEFLLRQRLQVLENYNNVLERKKAKTSGVRKQDALLQDLSEFSASDLEDKISAVKSKQPHTIVYKNKNDKEQKHLKSHKHKKRKVEQKLKEKKKVHYRKRLEVKVISESSEESEDEYRNKRRKLANAVAFHRDTNDKTSLQERLNKMLCKSKTPELDKPIVTITENKQTEMPELNINVPVVTKSNNMPTVTIEAQATEDKSLPENASELIDLSSDEDINAKVDENIASDKQPVDVVDAVTKDNCNNVFKKDLKADSDEDLELLRQHALKTKTSKAKVDMIDKTVVSVASPKPTSEDEDSDTAELRLICLKSALLKKAIEMKQKQKLQKKLSQSSNLQDDFLVEKDELMNQIQSENNTDIESVDMDIGSDGEDKGKDVSSENSKVTTKQDVVCDHNENIKKDTQKPNMRKEDELEEDEDLLRAKLLTSLSKNLPHLVDPSALNTVEDDNKNKHQKEIAKEKVPSVSKTKIPENRIVINLGESDSDGEEHEATKNLTKMHMKLSEQVDFQEKLDIFLKSTRMEVEKSKLPDVVQEPLTPRTKEKFVAKNLNHLPKTEQIEYRNLVKRMAELEKIKQARQTSMNLVNQVPVKDTLKPRNVTVDPEKFVTINQIEEQIALSRKKIAEESAIMLKLKEQATKLSQKYKIVATELKNIATAITLNKKEQRSAQNRLSKIRNQHQRLLNSSTTIHSKTNGNLAVSNPINRDLATAKLQKENNPKNDDYKNSAILKSVKVSVANQADSVSNNARVSVQVEVINNKKTVKMSNEKSSTRVVEIQKDVNIVNNNMNNQSDTVSNNERLSVQVDVVNNKVKLPSEKSSSTRAVEIKKDMHHQDKLDDLKEGNAGTSVVEKGGGRKCNASETRIETRKELEEYKSPLQALDDANWEADPNAILCPFEVGGNCKDPDCKFLHPKVPQ